MIQENQIGWLKDFLFGLCVSPEDKKDMEEIIETFRKLWRATHAAEQNPYPRSPRLDEALASIKPPGPTRETFKQGIK